MKNIASKCNDRYFTSMSNSYNKTFNIFQFSPCMVNKVLQTEITFYSKIGKQQPASRLIQSELVRGASEGLKAISVSPKAK